MPPTLILIRHAEALHNATNKFLCPHFEEPEVLIRIVQNWKLLDPELTDGGVQQCQDLERHLKHIPLASRIEHIITSPMRRTLETTLISLKWLVDSGVPVSVDPMWQENSTENCDTGLPIHKTASLFPSLDFTSVDPIYPDKSLGTPYAFTSLANARRGEDCLKALYTRPEKVIAVVSHSGFLRTGITRRKFGNADYRIFTFGSGEKGWADLMEDGETERKGGGLGRSQRGVWKVRDEDFPLGSIGEDGEDVPYVWPKKASHIMPS